MNNIEITIAETIDLNIISECATLMSGSDPWKSLRRNTPYCLSTISGSDKTIFIGRGDGTLLGFAVIQQTGTLKGYIQSICIRETFRGQGIGSRLLRHCEAVIFKQFPNVFLLVSSFNINAQHFYAQHGYLKVGELQNFFVEGQDEWLLRKTTGPMTNFYAHADCAE